jgi:hypothetical protein
VVEHRLGAYILHPFLHVVELMHSSARPTMTPLRCHSNGSIGCKARTHVTAAMVGWPLGERVRKEGRRRGANKKVKEASSAIGINSTPTSSASRVCGKLCQNRRSTFHIFRWLHGPLARLA